MNYIKRSIEEIVQKLDKTFKCILVAGARPTGKSTMLKKLFPDKKYISFDDPSTLNFVDIDHFFKVILFR